MTAPSESQIAAVLGEHEDWQSVKGQGGWYVYCTCGENLGLDVGGGDAVHRAHVAAVLAALFTKRDAEQRREAIEEAADLPWRADHAAGHNWLRTYAAETYPSKEADR